MQVVKKNIDFYVFDLNFELFLNLIIQVECDAHKMATMKSLHLKSCISSPHVYMYGI